MNIKILLVDLLTVFRKHLKPKPEPTNREKIGDVVGSLLAQIKEVEESQKRINDLRAGLAQLAFDLQDAGVLAEIEKLAALAPRPESVPAASVETKPNHFDKRCYDGSDNMFG